MSTHRASAAYEAIDLILVGVFLAALAVFAVSARQWAARRRIPRAWLRDFRADARERQEDGP